MIVQEAGNEVEANSDAESMLVEGAAGGVEEKSSTCLESIKTRWPDYYNSHRSIAGNVICFYVQCVDSQFTIELPDPISTPRPVLYASPCNGVDLIPRVIHRVETQNNSGLYSPHIFIIIQIGHESNGCNFETINRFESPDNYTKITLKSTQNKSKNHVLIHLKPVRTVGRTRRETIRLTESDARLNERVLRKNPKKRGFTGGFSRACSGVLEILVAAFARAAAPPTRPPVETRHVPRFDRVTVDRLAKVARHAYEHGVIPSRTASDVRRLFAWVFGVDLVCADYASTAGVFHRVTRYVGDTRPFTAAALAAPAAAATTPAAAAAATTPRDLDHHHGHHGPFPGCAIFMYRDADDNDDPRALRPVTDGDEGVAAAGGSLFLDRATIAHKIYDDHRVTRDTRFKTVPPLVPFEGAPTTTATATDGDVLSKYRAYLSRSPRAPVAPAYK